MELDQLTGIGAATEERVRAAGASNVKELAELSVEQLEEQGISEGKAEKLISRASRQSIIFQTGSEAKQEKEEKNHITSGMDALDDLLGGGFLEGHVVGISGETSSGKTQTAFRALSAAIEDTGDPAIYIETERDRFDFDRIASLSSMDPGELDDKIYRVKAYSLDKQRETYAAIQDNFDDVSIVIVDSFTARFRLAEVFEGRASLTERNAEMVRHLNAIERVVDQFDCPAILTLQIMGNPQRFGGSEATWGGSIMDHQITYTLKMKKAQGEFRKAQLAGHPSQPEGEVLVSIGSDRIEASQDG